MAFLESEKWRTLGSLKFERCELWLLEPRKVGDSLEGGSVLTGSVLVALTVNLPNLESLEELPGSGLPVSMSIGKLTQSTVGGAIP